MATFVTLVNWTDQGIRKYEDTTKRAEDFAALVQKSGGRVVDFYWTIGQYDVVAVVEAPDDETATAALLHSGSLGNIRTTTLRAFGREEMDRIIAKAAG